MDLCYILVPGDFQKKSNVYKIGKTTRDISKRLAEYPKGSQVIKTWKVTDCDTVEKLIIRSFGNKYELVQGFEYFKGDLASMIVDIDQIVSNLDGVDKESLCIKKKIKSKKVAADKPKGKEYRCHCGKSFTSRAGICKHRKGCNVHEAVTCYTGDLVMTAEKVKFVTSENEVLRGSLAELKETVVYLRGMNDKLQQSNLELTAMVNKSNAAYRELSMKQTEKLAAPNGNKSIIGSTGTLVKFLQKHNHSVPTIKSMSKKTIENKLNEDGSLGLRLVNSYTNGDIENFLGGLLVKNYEKKIPRKQSIWATDAERTNYIVNITVNSDKIWTRDAKGIYVRKAIIKPMIVLLRKEVEEFYDEIKEQDPTDERAQTMKNVSELLEEMGYKDGKGSSRLANKINKYMASNLFIDEKAKAELIKQ